MHHMTSNNLFSDQQFGFRNKRSCVLQLLTTLDEFTQNYDANLQTDTIYLDIQKAFDTIPHNRLIQKLKAYGVEGPILEWITNFLFERKQRVCVDGCFSSWQPISSGVPQGSVVGPILFIIYINDLPDVIQSMCKIFADDTKIYRPINSPDDQQTLQEDLFRLCDWSDDWLLKFSIPKCKCVQFGYVRHTFNYAMRDSNSNTTMDLPIVDEERDLGIVFQSNLKFNKHVVNIVNRTKRLTGLVKRSFS